MLRAPIIALVGLGAGLVAMGAGCGPAAGADPATVTITGTTTVPATTVPAVSVDQPCGYCTTDGRVLPDCAP